MNGLINFADKFKLFNDHWAPRVIGELNDYQFKLVKVQGDFVWHKHDDTDEAFIVLKGCLRIDFRDSYVEFNPGEMYVVRKGIEHKPSAEQEVEMLLIEPGGVVNTGDEQNDLTAQMDVWI
jgi:mannose-6-phosphate isomerase-like protein (cupin superfamily)